MTEAQKDGPRTSRLSADGFDSTTVAVIIPIYNQAHFLAAAIESVLAQTRPADGIIVIDDGSTDDPGAIVGKFPGVRLIRQENRGPNCARNTGLRSCTMRHVVFLDADDRLLPKALEAGLACIESRPECAFVYGGLRHISEDGSRISADCILHVGPDPHLAFIRQNLVLLPAVALHRRDLLLAVGGFDETLRRAEDYDLYLRTAQTYPIASHSEIVAEYRKHGGNVSDNHLEMLRSTLDVLRCHEARTPSTAATRAAFRAGRACAREFYVSAMLNTASASWRATHGVGRLMKDMIRAAQWSPRVTTKVLVRAVRRRAIKALPASIAQHWII